MKRKLLKLLVIVTFPIWLLPVGIVLAAQSLSEMAEDAMNWFDRR